MDMEQALELRQEGKIKSKGETKSGQNCEGERGANRRHSGAASLPAFSPIHPSSTAESDEPQEGFPTRDKDKNESGTFIASPIQAPIMMPKKKGKDLTPDKEDADTAKVVAGTKRLSLGSISPLPTVKTLNPEREDSNGARKMNDEAGANSNHLVVKSPVKKSKSQRRASTSIQNLPEGLNLGSKGENEGTGFVFDCVENLENSSSESDYSPTVSDPEDDDEANVDRMRMEALAMLVDEAAEKMAGEMKTNPNRLFVQKDSREGRTWSTTTIPDVPAVEADDGNGPGLSNEIMLVDSSDDEEEGGANNQREFQRKKSPSPTKTKRKETPGPSENIKDDNNLDEEELAERQPEKTAVATLKSAVNVKGLSSSPVDIDANSKGGTKKNRKSPTVLVRKSSASRLKIKSSPSQNGRKKLTRKKSNPESTLRSQRDQAVAPSDPEASEDDPNPYSRESMKQSKSGPQPVPNPSSKWLNEESDPWDVDATTKTDSPESLVSKKLPPRPDNIESMRKLGTRKLSPLKNRPKSLRKTITGSFRNLSAQEVLAGSFTDRAANLTAKENLRQHQEMLMLAMEEISALHFENEVLNMKVTQLQQDFNAQLWDLESKRHRSESQVQHLEEKNRKQEEETNNMVSQLKQQMEQGLKQAVAKIQRLEEELQQEKDRRKKIEEARCIEHELKKSPEIVPSSTVNQAHLHDVPI